MNTSKFMAMAILSLASFKTYSARICYFSLNNEKEFHVMEEFTEKLNRYSPIKIEVQEFLPKGGDTKEAFKRMVESGVVCDGLVISGHHTGSFGGKRATGSLSIDLMEELSCNPKYKAFFNNVKGLWLQGCRTLGVSKIETTDTADFHTQRVGAVLDEDHLTQSFSDLNVEFSATLDQDNPLSSRYLRVFPRATTFGWTKTAPGSKSRSQYSVPFHIAHMARLNDDRKRYFDNPISGKMTEKSARKYISALALALDLKALAPSTTETGCRTRDLEEQSVEAWLHHGQKSKGYRYSFANADLNGYVSMFQTDDEFLHRAKEIECFLKSTKDPNVLLSRIDEILQSEELIGYSFNSLFEVLKRFRGEPGVYSKIQDKLRQSPLLKKFLMRKLASSELGIIRKVEYYSFVKDLLGLGNKNIEKLIRDNFFKLAARPITRGSWAQYDFIRTLTKSLAKHRLLLPEHIEKLIFSPEVSDKVKKVAINSLSLLKDPNRKIEGVINKILDSKTLYLQGTPYFLADAVGSKNITFKNPMAIINKILNRADVDDRALGSLLSLINNNPKRIQNPSELIHQIVTHPKADSFTFMPLSGPLTNENIHIENLEELFTQVIRTHPKSAVAIGNDVALSKLDIEGKRRIYRKVYTSENRQEYSFHSKTQILSIGGLDTKHVEEYFQDIKSMEEIHDFYWDSIPKVISAYGGKVKGSFEMMERIAKENKDLGYNTEFFKAIEAPGFTNEQRVKLIESAYEAKSKSDSREPGLIMKIISSTDFSKEQRDHLIKLTYDNITKNSYFGTAELIKVLKEDKTIKGRKEMLRGIARQARFSSHKYEAKEILEKERPRKWYEIF